MGRILRITQWETDRCVSKTWPNSETRIKLKSGPTAKLRLTGHRVTLEVMDDSHVLANQQFGLA